MLVMDKDEVLQFVRDRQSSFDATGDINPFASSDWMLHFIEQIAERNWSFIVAANSPDDDTFMLLHRASPGHGMSAVANYYSSLYSPIIGTRDPSAEVLNEIICDLSRGRPRPSTVDLAPLDDPGHRVRALREAFASNGWYAKQYFCFGNWYLPTEGLSYADYIAARTSQVQNTLARKSRKFDGKKARIDIATTPDQVEIALEAFASVYAKSWKKPEPYPEFVPGWARICARNGWLRLGVAWLDDVPIAAQFWFTKNRRAYIFKLAYDEEYSKWSAGTVLTAFMIKHSLEQDGVIEIDYLTGDDAYKKAWMSERRERVGIRACNLRSSRGLLNAAFEKAGDFRRQWSNSLGTARTNGRD